MEKRYQIFISSTHDDLIEEREKVSQAILQLNHFPAKMELFPAVGISPMELIKGILKECDYFILIMGDRYGSVRTSSRKSYTEEEYDYAVQQGIPVIAFLLNDKEFNDRKTNEDNDTQKKLLNFRNKVMDNEKHTVRKWSKGSPDALSLSVVTSIHHITDIQERTGWIRADILDKYQELKKEYQKSQDEIKRLKGLSEKPVNENIIRLKSENDWSELFDIRLKIKYKSIYSYTTTYMYMLTVENELKQWYRIIAKIMMNIGVHVSEDSILQRFETYFYNPYIKRSLFPVAKQTIIEDNSLHLTDQDISILTESDIEVLNISIERNDLAIILQTLEELGVIVANYFNQWELTEEGFEIFRKLNPDV